MYFVSGYVNKFIIKIKVEIKQRLVNLEKYIILFFKIKKGNWNIIKYNRILASGTPNTVSIDVSFALSKYFSPIRQGKEI